MTRRFVLPALCFLLLALATNVVRAADEAYPPTATLDDVKAAIAAAPKTHPRLFATADEFEALREAVQRDAFKKRVADEIVKTADALMEVEPVVHEKEGRRLLEQSRRCLKRVTTLATAYQLTLDDKYAKRCEKEMLAAAAFADWNPTHFLDVGEMTLALAIGYDWLYDRLSPESRATIREAILEKGVKLPFETNYKGWVRSSNNWGQVCHGGLVCGALAVMEDEPELAAKTVHNALQNVTRSIAAFAPKGSYPEGPGYWAYGTTFNVVLVDALESTLGSSFGLVEAPGFAETGQYLPMVTGPSGKTFNYADGGDGRSAQPALFWFARRFDRPDWLLGEHDRWMGSVGGDTPRSAGSSSGRLAPLALLWMNGVAESVDEIRMPLHWSSEGDVPITIHRSSWTNPNRTFVGFKGGKPSSNHGQMDTGSFVLDADGVRWAKDLGAEGYHGIESRGMNLWDRTQKSDRWTIFRQMNEGHNTLVIDGQLQKVDGAGRFIAFSDDPAHPHSILDMTATYEGQASKVVRGIAMLPTGEVLIRDEIEGLKPGAQVRWGMITSGEIEKIDGAKVLLKQGDATLTMTRVTDAGTWEEIETAKPRNEWDSANRGTRMLALQAVAPESGKLKIEILATPGSCK